MPWIRCKVCGLKLWPYGETMMRLPEHFIILDAEGKQTESWIRGCSIVPCDGGSDQDPDVDRALAEAMARK